MRHVRTQLRLLPAAALVALLGLVLPCLAADTVPPALLCSNEPGAPACGGSKQDLKRARAAFARGIKLEKSQQLDRALYEFEDASRRVPQNVEYLTARELVRQRLAGVHLERGNNELLAGRNIEAMAEFRAALNFDPQNEFAMQRIGDAIGPAPVRASAPPQVVDSKDAVAIRPIDARHDFHYRGDSRGLLTAIATSYGLTIDFDETFPSRRVRFDLENADFGTALQTAEAVTRSFTFAIEDTELYACAETPENHRLYDRMAMRSFYVPGATAAQDLNEVVNSLRTLFDFKFVTLNTSSNIITVRGPRPLMEAATDFLEQINNPRPEVLLDFKVFQVSHSYARNIGLHIPNTFNLFNIPAAALAALGGQNLQDLINQLVASGGINQAGNQSIQALLAQLQSQQNSIFSQPLATFGGGLTLEGLSLDHLAASLSMNESSVQSLDHAQLRASQQKDTTFKLGSRYPILNASFAPIYNNAAIAKVVGNQSYTAAFPSVSYEDIGLSIKAKPLVHNNSDVALELELQFRTLGNLNVNGIPDILNREFKGGILVKDGEPAVVAGMVTLQDQKSLAGIPAFSRIPGLGMLSSENSKQNEADELLVLITPHVIRAPERTEAPEIWLPK